MSRIRNDSTQREIWGDPQQLSDTELAKAERWWRSEVARYPRGWAAIDHLNRVLAEKEKRTRQDRLASEIKSLREVIGDLGQTTDRLSDSLRETNERLEDLNRQKRR